MNVEILSFASASDAIGCDRLSIQVDDGTTVEGLRHTLDQRYPALQALWSSLAIAVDGEIASSDRVLNEGAEVALLPPVSGGSESGQDRSSFDQGSMARLTLDPIDLNRAVREVERPSAGAVLVFVGNVRDHHQGRAVERITYSAYRTMAEQRLRSIETDLEREHEGLRIRIVHRLGRIEVGAASIAIAASSAHREDAYQANRRALERVKTEVPIWKREHYQDGEARWREEERLRPLADGAPG